MGTLKKMIVVSLLLFCVAFPSALFILGSRERGRAEAFLADLAKLKLGEATFEDAQRLAARYGGQPWRAISQPATCTARECYLNFDFANPCNLLPFALVSRVALRGIVHVRDGRVIGIDVGYQMDSKYGGRAAYELQDSFFDASPSEHEKYTWVSSGFGIAKLKVDRKGVPWVVEVRLNKSASQKDKEHAYSLNLSCLGKFYGCTSPSSVVPSL